MDATLMDKPPAPKFAPVERTDDLATTSASRIRDRLLHGPDFATEFGIVRERMTLNEVLAIFGFKPIIGEPISLALDYASE